MTAADVEAAGLADAIRYTGTLADLEALRGRVIRCGRQSLYRVYGARRRALAAVEAHDRQVTVDA